MQEPVVQRIPCYSNRWRSLLMTSVVAPEPGVKIQRCDISKAARSGEAYHMLSSRRLFGSCRPVLGLEELWSFGVTSRRSCTDLLMFQIRAPQRFWERGVSVCLACPADVARDCNFLAVLRLGLPRVRPDCAKRDVSGEGFSNLLQLPQAVGLAKRIIDEGGYSEVGLSQANCVVPSAPARH